MKFGTSGIRGLASDLVGNPSGLYTEAFAQRLRSYGVASGSPVFIGQDQRDSSPAIAEICMNALAASGFQPVDCGAIPTPALALYAWKHGAAALMVTGSHIPADRNGIKFYGLRGEIDKNDEAEMTRYATENAATYSLPVALETAFSHRQADALKAYRARANDILAPGALSGMRVGVYQHSSVAAQLLVDILESFGASVTALGKTESFVPVDTEAVDAGTRSRFKTWAAEFKLDAIVSTDADADRPLLADENGELFRGDLIGLVTALFLKADTVVTPVTSNSGISNAFGFDVIRTKVGSPYVIEAMEKSLHAGKTVIGFEANGGVLLGSDCAPQGRTVTALPTRDSVLPILAVLGTLALERKPLSRLRADLRLPVCASERLENFPLENSRSLMKHLETREALGRFLAQFGCIMDVDLTDGIRVSTDAGEIIHLRPSGNAPELRCYSEAADYGRASEIVELTLNKALAFASNEIEVVS